MKFENKKAIVDLYETYMDEIYEVTQKEKDLTHKQADLEDELRKSLTSKQSEILEQIDQIETQRTEDLTKHTFVFAYSLANKLLIQSLLDDKTTKITSE